MERGLIKENATKVGTGQRAPLYSNTETPGPAHYNPGSRPDSAAFSMGISRPKEKAKALQPGPGAYDPDVGSMKENGPTVRIGTATRGNQGSWKDGAMPGPGNYNIDAYNRGPAVAIGSG